MTLRSNKTIALAILLVAIPLWAQTVSTSTDDTILRQIIIFGRHNVRSTTVTASDFALMSVRPNPDFGVPPGYLTPHGRQAELLLGGYYRDYLLHERLLTGQADFDATRAYFRSNSIQRSNITAGALAEALFPGVTVPVHSFALGQPDPVFDPIAAKLVAVDPVRAVHEVRAVFHSGTALTSAYSSDLALIRSLLFNYPNGTQPPPPAPSGLVDVTAQPIPLVANTTNLSTGNVINGGGLLSTLGASDPFVMEYADGLPLKDVAWGQLSMDTLSQQTRIVNLAFAVEARTPYLNRLQSSNAASHILRTMEQAVIGDTVPGAFGNGQSRVNVIISSDFYVIGMAEMLKMRWQLPGYQPDFCPPGGALVFELRQSRTTGQYVVRAHFTAQTLDQLRNLTPLTLDQPPATTPLLIPGGRPVGESMDITFASFQKLLRATIDPNSVEDPAKEVAPSPLSGVPLK